LLGQASNLDPPNLSLPSSWDCRREPPAPGKTLLVRGVEFGAQLSLGHMSSPGKRELATPKPHVRDAVGGSPVEPGWLGRQQLPVWTMESPTGDHTNQGLRSPVRGGCRIGFLEASWSSGIWVKSDL
jgi:hypothetical protein